ncbi:MAG: copper-binding protein [Kofleriaceae bacterium]|nr:copper-binding protein [Kofleriaceae bacterium]
MKLTAIWLVVALAAACGSEDKPRETTTAPARERFTSRGKVIAIDDKRVEIHHEAMPSVRGYDGTLGPMMSMTMAFAVPPGGPGSIAVGDVVAFEFTVHFDSEPTLRLTRLDKLPAGTTLVLE